MENRGLRIENPCPISLLALKKTGGNYQCGSCNKTVIDFRKLSQSEFETYISPDVCGIFDSHQLPAQSRPNVSRRIRFAILATFSVLGFQLRVPAQTTQKAVSTNPVTQKQAVKYSGKNSLPVCPRKTETPVPAATSEPKKKTFRTIGCPSF